MGRTPLYSRSPQRAAAPQDARSGIGAVPVGRAGLPAATPTAAGVPADASPPPGPPRWHRRAGQALARRERWLWAGAALLLAGLAAWPTWTQKAQRPLTLAQIDSAMRDSIAKQPLPSAAAAAYEAILPSVVRVIGEHPDADAERTAPYRPGRPGGKPGRDGAATAPGAASSPALPPGHAPLDREGLSVGTGVVIVDKGLILTNLHVVEGATKLTITFFDGSDSEAVVVNRDPANDLAVLQAKTIPDDLHAATLRSTAGLAPGDEVLAVGFPFGIGPSASAGVVSGLKREFRSPEPGGTSRRTLSNLIQFDAAANPGNSGGPLVTMDGHVAGIVTAIMNPSGAHTFIGIGFAVPIENAAGAVGLHPF